MVRLKLFISMFIVILLTACQEYTEDVFPEVQPVTYLEKLSFIVNGKTYSFDDRSGSGMGNRQINIKPYDTAIDGRRYAYETGNYFWYGEKDSTLFSLSYGLRTKNENSSAQITFTKKFHNTQLRESLNMKIPDNTLTVLKEGQQAFAVDFEKENTTDGIALELRLADFNKELTSYMPGFSILVRPELNKDIQKNSTFEIINVSKIDDNYIYVQAKFELNLYDGEGKLYKLEKGLLAFRTVVTMKSSFDMP